VLDRAVPRSGSRRARINSWWHHSMGGALVTDGSAGVSLHLRRATTRETLSKIGRRDPFYRLIWNIDPCFRAPGRPTRSNPLARIRS